MKIREIRVQNFRNFGPELRSVKFYDEATGLVRPLSVLVGSNGCGKTTLLEIMVSLLENAARAAGHKEPKGLVSQAMLRRRPATITLSLSVDQAEAEQAPALREPFQIGVAPQGTKDRRDVIWTSMATVLDVLNGAPGVAPLLREWVDKMLLEEQLRGGVIYMPHNRWIEHRQQGSIAPPARQLAWVSKFSANPGWEGSLAQFWVWQNYLDLEQGREGRANLAPFVETIEEILGRGRKIRIKKGVVVIDRPDLGDSVGPDALPSGEQQILNIFGEIARMLRPGAVILIDEVEISLHPALQRAVLFHLRRLAAKYDLQIIVTTHSMEIVSAVAPEEVINLDDMAVVEQSRAPEQT